MDTTKHSNHRIALYLSLSVVLLIAFQRWDSAGYALLCGLAFTIVYTLLFFWPAFVYRYEVPQKTGVLLRSLWTQLGNSLNALIAFSSRIKDRILSGIESIGSAILHVLSKLKDLALPLVQRFIQFLKRIIQREIRYAKYDLKQLKNWIGRLFG